MEQSTDSEIELGTTTSTDKHIKKGDARERHIVGYLSVATASLLSLAAVAAEEGLKRLMQENRESC